MTYLHKCIQSEVSMTNGIVVAFDINNTETNMAIKLKNIVYRTAITHMYMIVT